MTDDHDRILALEEQAKAMATTICDLCETAGRLADEVASTNLRLTLHADEIMAITVRLPREPR